MSDVFGRRPGDERLDAEVSSALAARVHRRSRIATWMGRIALLASVALAVVTAIAMARGVAGRIGPVLAVVSAVVLVAAVVLVVFTARRTRRLLEASAPEGGVVLGMSSAGINLTHLPLLEWDAVTAIAVAERRTARALEVTVGLAVADVDAARARIIDARLLHLVRPFPRRSSGGSAVGHDRDVRREPGFLSVDLGDLLPADLVGTVVRRLREEAERRDIPLHRVDDRRRLAEVLRPPASTGD